MATQTWQAYFDAIAAAKVLAEVEGHEVGALPERETVVFAGEPLEVTESQHQALEMLLAARASDA